MTATFSFNVDQPKAARSYRRRLNDRVKRRMMPMKGHPSELRAKRLVEDIWPLIAMAYSLGYSTGHEDQMQMRIRDALERKGVSKDSADTERDA